MKRIPLILGIVVVMVSNIFLLSNVAANRSGKPVQTLELTERELPMAPRDQEDSSVRLYLAWRSDDPAPRRFRHELVVVPDDNKLRELGFRLSVPDSKSPHFRVPLARPVYYALELRERGGEPPHQETAIKAGPAGQPQRGPMPASGYRTRLTIVDVAGNFDQLRVKYSDPNKHMIVRGVLNARPVETEGQPHRWAGYVGSILPPEIQVPLPFAAELNRLAGEKGEQSQYTVTLHYGRNVEPWVGAVRAGSR